MTGEIFTIIMVSIGCGTAIVIVFLAMLFGLIKNRRRQRTLTNDEGEVLEQVWDGLQKMEDRINNLETIMLHRKKMQDFERKL